MALDNFRKVNITLNKANQRVLETQIAKVGDANGRELVVQITNNGVIEDQTGTTLKLNWQHENGKQGSTTFNVVDIKTGKFSVYYPKEMLYKGKVNASIEITSNGQITNSMNFKIIVQADVFDGEGGIVDGVFISLAEVNKKLDDREAEYEELKTRQTSVETKFNSVQQELTDKDVISAPEIIAARNGETNLKARLDKEQQEVTAQLAQTAQYVRDIEVNVKLLFGTALTPAKGDGVTDDWQALTDIAQYCVDNNYRMKIPEGNFIVSKPLEMLSRLMLSGNGRRTKIIKKTTTPNAKGVNAVINAHQKNNFEIKDIELVGDRTDYASGNNVTVDGLKISECSYFNVESTWAINCRKGYDLLMNWCCSYIRPTAQQCQGYAFTLKNATTSTTMINPTGWGCGGMFDMYGVIYSTIINPACDHSDVGGHPQDPFLPQGGGGNYLSPSYIYKTSSSNVVIISSGTENSYSKYLYSEGGSIVFLNPYVYNISAHAENFNFIDVRGTGLSSIEFVNPHFTEVKNALTVSPYRRGIYVENPDRQKIKTNKHIAIDDSYGDYKYSDVDGIEYVHSKTLAHLNQSTIEVSGSSPLVVDVSKGSINNVYEQSEKRIKLTNLQSSETDFRLPLNVSRFNQIKYSLRGYNSSQYAAVKIRFIEVIDGQKKVIKSFDQLIGGNFVLRGLLNINSSNPCYLEFTSAHSSDNIYLTKMELSEVQ